MKNSNRDLRELLNCISAINKSLSIEKVLGNTISHIQEILGVEAVSIWEYDEKKNELFFRILKGEKTEKIVNLRLKEGVGIAGKTFLDRKFKIINDIEKNRDWNKSFDKISGFKTKNMLVGPLSIENKVIGVIQIMNKIGGDFTTDDLEYIKIISSPISIALENAKLYEKEKRLLFELALSLSLAIEKRDPYTGGHTKRVLDYSILIAEGLNLSKWEIERLKISAILHDIGKIGVPDAILNKKGALTDKEKELMKKHPTIGAEIVSNIEGMEDVVEGIKYHHEKYDGSGYPEGLKGKEIPLFARIIAIADTFDAITTERPYKKALSKEFAIKELVNNQASQFDPELINLFMESLKKSNKK